MALLQATNAVFYHPLDNRVEDLQSKTWTLYGATTSISGYDRPFLVSGLLNNNSSAGTIYGDTSDYGGYPTDATSLTAAFWISGINSNNRVILGWGNTSLITPKTAIGVVHHSTSNTLRVQVYSVSSSAWSGVGLTIPDDPAWIVARVAWSGNGWFYAWASFNGEDWQFAGSGNLGTPDSAGTLIGINAYEQGSPGIIGVDEAVLWKNADMFSSRELERLYLLTNDDAKRMTEFTQNYGWTTIDASGTLFIHGATSASGNATLYASRNFVYSSISLFCSNDSLASGSISLYTIAPTYYRQDYLQWYHPLSNSTTEQYRDKDWNAWSWRVPPTYGPYENTPVFGPGARGFALAADTAQVLGSVDSIYTSGSNSGSLPLPWFMTQWVSGSCRSSAFIRQGWGSTSVVPSEFPHTNLTDCISLSYDSPSGMKVAIYASKRLAISGILPYEDRYFKEWHFIAAYLDYEYNESEDIVALRLWASLDANEWQQIGYVAGNTFQFGTYDSQPIYPQIEIQDNVNLPFLPSGAIDEVACWKGLPSRPTQQDLHTLHETTVRGLGLDSFYAVDIGFELKTTSLNISGPLLSSGSCDLHIQHNPHNCADLFVSGYTPHGQWPLVMRTERTIESGLLSLIVNGTASGESRTAFGSVDLYVGFVPSEDDPWWYHPTYVAGPQSWPMFLKAGTWSTEMPVSGHWDFVMRVGGKQFGVCDLFMSGSPPGYTQGRTVAGGMSASLTGWYPGQLDDGLSDGFYPSSMMFSCVLQRQPGAVGEMTLAVSGFMWPSGSCELYAFGVSGLCESNMDLFTATYDAKNSCVSCFVAGYTGRCSGSLNLVLELPPTDTIATTTPCRLYVHGY